jgi:hypothetical protein
MKIRASLSAAAVIHPNALSHGKTTPIILSESAECGPADGITYSPPDSLHMCSIPGTFIIVGLTPAVMLAVRIPRRILANDQPCLQDV